MTDTSEPRDQAKPSGASKLDPILRERLETQTAATSSEPGDSPSSGELPVEDDARAECGLPEEIEVMVAMAAPPTSDDIDALADRGLTVRSAIGDILTGVVAIDAVEHLADYEAILKIESSTPLGPDESLDDAAVAEGDGFDVNDFVE